MQCIRGPGGGRVRTLHASAALVAVCLCADARSPPPHVAVCVAVIQSVMRAPTSVASSSSGMNVTSGTCLDHGIKVAKDAHKGCQALAEATRCRRGTPLLPEPQGSPSPGLLQLRSIWWSTHYVDAPCRSPLPSHNTPKQIYISAYMYAVQHPGAVNCLPRNTAGVSPAASSISISIHAPCSFVHTIEQHKTQQASVEPNCT